MYGIADLDNCYVSCERVFRPDLKGIPVVVLSNNDGCVVARSNEAKSMGIKEGTPYFQLVHQWGLRPLSAKARQHINKFVFALDAPSVSYQKMAVFSSNYELYGELTGRVKREVGMPISIGLAPTKTLAKIASKLAKKFEAYNHCCMIDTDYKRKKALEWCPIEDVWGIGRRYASKLHSLGVSTALDFSRRHKDWVRTTFNNINIVRTWQELNGEDAVPNEELAKKKSICTSRSFNGMVSDINGLRTQVSNYAARCAEKLRQQGTVASVIGVFLQTNVFREDLAQYWNFQERHLITPSSSTTTIVQAANDVLKGIFRPGYQYKKAGVIVMGIEPDSPIQQDLFDIDTERFQKMRRLDEAVDRINCMHGSETIVIGSQQYTKRDGKGKADVFANAIKHDFKSPNPTTRWSDIIKLK